MYDSNRLSPGADRASTLLVQEQVPLGAAMNIVTSLHDYVCVGEITYQL